MEGIYPLYFRIPNIGMYEYEIAGVIDVERMRKVKMRFGEPKKFGNIEYLVKGMIK